MDFFHNWLRGSPWVCWNNLTYQDVWVFSPMSQSCCAEAWEIWMQKNIKKTDGNLGNRFRFQTLQVVDIMCSFPTYWTTSWQDLRLNSISHLCGLFWVEDRTQWNPCCFCQIPLEISCKCSHGPNKNYVEISIAVFFFDGICWDSGKLALGNQQLPSVCQVPGCAP